MSDEYDSWADEEDWSNPESESAPINCPECGFEVHEEADLCPRCGYFFEESSVNTFDGKPGWFLVLGLLGIIATILALSGLF